MGVEQEQEIRMKFISVFSLLIGTQGTKYGDLFEGDIAVQMGQSSLDGFIQRGFRSDEKYKWGKLIQYSIDRSLSAYHERIVECLDWIEERSCLSFRESNRGDHIKFTTFGDRKNPGKGCWSYIGRQGGGQALNLETPGCVSKATIFHEILHALGKVHEHTRPDRDDHVEIKWSNIKKEKVQNFYINKFQVDTAGTPYDLFSIMHYSPYAFAINKRKPTIISKNHKNAKFGEQEEPSDIDMKELNAAYQCENKPNPEQGCSFDYKDFEFKIDGETVSFEDYYDYCEDQYNDNYDYY